MLGSVERLDFLDFQHVEIWLLAGGLCSRTRPPKTLCQPCAGGGVGTLCRARRRHLVPGGGAKPCARYLCEDLVPGTFAVI